MFVATRSTPLASSLRPFISNSAKFNSSRARTFGHLGSFSTPASGPAIINTPAKLGAVSFQLRVQDARSYTTYVPSVPLSTLIGESFTIGQNKIAPMDISKTLPAIGVEVMRKHFSKDTVDLTLKLMNLANDSVQQASLDDEKVMVEKISGILSTLSPESYKSLIKALYVYTKLTELENDSPALSNSKTSLRDVMTKLLETKTISEAIACMPKTLTDVLTAHPVRPDQGEVIRASHALTIAHQEWRNTIEAYEKSDISQQSAICEKANQLRKAMVRNIVDLCTSDHIPTVRVLPEDEQRNISILVKNNEKQLLDAMGKIHSVIRLSFFEQMAKEISEKGPVEQQEMATILGKPAEERLRELGNHPLIQGHADYEKVMQCVDKVRYAMQRWYLDQDGNPNVNARTGGNAIADGRRLALGDITEEHGLVKFADSEVQDSDLETMKGRLEEMSHHSQWGPYIDNKLKRGWRIVKIYSGLMVFKARAAIKAAEAFQNDPQAPFSLLREGFADSEKFLESIKPLVSSEKALGVDGFWSEQNELVKMRGIELGLPHIRNGEAYFAKLLSEALPILGLSGTQPFSKCDIPTKKEILKAFLAGPTPDLPLDFHLKLTEDSQKFYTNLKDAMSISPLYTLIASDAAGEHGDVELAILVMKSASKLIGHKGEVVVLLEDEEAMSSGIALMKNKNIPNDFFPTVMSAGSDNQKKDGLFTSVQKNCELLGLGILRRIKTFFGQGDSAHRSDTLPPATDKVTMQPGNQGKFLGRGKGLIYLEKKVADQVSTRAYVMREDSAERAQEKMILDVMADAVHRTLKESLQDYPELRKSLLDYLQTPDNTSSRPGSKPKGGDIIIESRAIGSAFFQLTENTCDPQLAGLVQGIQIGIEKLEKEHGIPLTLIQRFFIETLEGQAIIAALCDFHSFIDPALEDTKGIQKTTHEDVAKAIFMLTGNSAPPRKTDYITRLARIMYRQVPFESKPNLLLWLKAHHPV